MIHYYLSVPIHRGAGWSDTLDRATRLWIYESQATIVALDEEFRRLISAGTLALIYYSPRGQECIASALGACLRADDFLVTTYRGLHDQVAKGVPLRELVAEYLGRATGACGGKGGPMHVTHVQSGVMVTTGIVGAGLPIANGLALSAVLDGIDRVTAVCFGDAATNIGAFHEALNLAAVWRLPVVFVCQNNLYGEHTAVADSMAVATIAERAGAYGMPGVRLDGNDVDQAWSAISEAVQRARANGGPTLIDAVTYRFWGHFFGDSMEYMPAEELAAAMHADPVPRFRASLAADGHATLDQLEAIDEQIARRVADAFEYALDCPLPDPSALLDDVVGATAEAS
jgi:pyruvate dehydrogenase E1 component alpha subunit